MRNIALSRLLDDAVAQHPELLTLSREILAHTEGPLPTSKKVFDVREGVSALTGRLNLMLEGASNVITNVAGPTGSGKTSVVSTGLAAEVDGAQILSADHFYTGNTAMTANAVPNWDHPNAVDLGSANAAVQVLAAGERVQIPIYSKKTSEPDGKQWIEPSKLLVVEGLFVLDGRMECSPGMRVYVHVPFVECVRRRVIRDVLIRQLAGRDYKTELEYLWDVVREMHEEHVKPTMESADWVISNATQR
jgi:uridine kinase